MRGRSRPRQRWRNRTTLSVEQIVAWADAHHRRTGQWPRVLSGPIPESPGDTWNAIHKALVYGLRGLPGGSSLARLLAERRGARNHVRLPRFTQRQILAWADAYHGRAGKWPNNRSGAIPEAPGDTWARVDRALHQGSRGLPGRITLTKLLWRHRRVRNSKRPPRLTERQIITWARAHRRRTGAWPNMMSGPIIDAPGETWRNVHEALYKGMRGLPGGSSLRKLLQESLAGDARRHRAENSRRATRPMPFRAAIR